MANCKGSLAYRTDLPGLERLATQWEDVDRWRMSFLKCPACSTIYRLLENRQTPEALMDKDKEALRQDLAVHHPIHPAAIRVRGNSRDVMRHVRELNRNHKRRSASAPWR